MNKKYNLDADELEVINQIEKGEFSEDLTELENLKLAAKNTVEKNERVNLRINEKDLLVIKRKLDLCQYLGHNFFRFYAYFFSNSIGLKYPNLL